MTTSTTTNPVDASGAAPRDGQHDFDFIIGSWKVYLKRLQQPLTGATEWVEYEGTSTSRPIWDGRADVDEFRVHSAATGARIDGLTVRLYNRDTGEWSLYWANANNGSMSLPPTVGRFTDDGRGEFYDDEELDGRAIKVRYEWSEITPTSAKFVQSFSADSGETWEPNWISIMTRIAD